MWMPAARRWEIEGKVQEYIDSLKARWGFEINEEAEQQLRAGKRTELLGEYEFQQRQA